MSNSMYRGVLIDKENRTNYTNYESADITGLTVTGTGGPGAKTPNIAEAAVEINATGAWLEDVLIDGCTNVGLRMYFTDASTTVRNMTVKDAGDAGAGAGAHASGVAVRSSYFAPTFDGLSVTGSPGLAFTPPAEVQCKATRGTSAATPNTDFGSIWPR